MSVIGRSITWGSSTGWFGYSSCNSSSFTTNKWSSRNGTPFARISTIKYVINDRNNTTDLQIQTFPSPRQWKIYVAPVFPPRFRKNLCRVLSSYNTLTWALDWCINNYFFNFVKRNEKIAAIGRTKIGQSPRSPLKCRADGAKPMMIADTFLEFCSPNFPS